MTKLTFSASPSIGGGGDGGSDESNDDGEGDDNDFGNSPRHQWHSTRLSARDFLNSSLI